MAKLFIPRKNYLRNHDGKSLPRSAFADELANYLAIERWANTSTFGSSQRPATVTVAASNSLHAAVGNADFICTGSNDDATIQQAINFLPPGGGKVLFYEGTYHFFNTTSSPLAVPANVILEGMGKATIFQAASTNINASSFIQMNGAFSAVRFISFDGNGFNPFSVNCSTGTAGPKYVDWCWFVNNVGGGSCVQIQDQTDVTNCYFQRAVAGGRGINDASCVRSRILNCHFVNCSVSLVGAGLSTVIDHCFFEGSRGITMVGSGGASAVYYMAIRNCHFYQLSATAVDFNTLPLGTSMIRDNLFDQCQTSPVVHIGNATDVDVYSNAFLGSSVTDIQVDNSAVRTSIQSNTFRAIAGGAAGRANNVIVSGAGCTDTLVTNNDAKGAFTGAFLADTGTGTITAAGNRT